MSVKPVHPAQEIALAMRDFANDRVASESQVAPFLLRVGGLPTIFALVVAISDSLHLGLVRRVLARLFDDSAEGRARILAPEVTGYLLAGLTATQPKHVRLVCLQQAHGLIRFAEGRDRLLQPDLFVPLVQLLRDDDVEITEEIMRLLRQIGSTHNGVARLLAPDTLALMFAQTLSAENTPDAELLVVNKHATDERVMAPFMDLLQQHAAAPASSRSASPLDSIVLLRVFTLLTQMACGTRLPADNGGPTLHPDPAHSADEIRAQAWGLYSQYGLFRLLLELASISPDNPNHDMLVQLNGLELLEEVVTACPKLDEAFAVQLTNEILGRAVAKIQTAAATAGKNATASLIPTSSFITVAVLHVFNRLAAVSSAKSVHGWYREPAFLLFLSACLNHYDDEAVQTEAIDLLTTLGSFAEGLQYFATVTSSLPATAAPSQASAYLSNPYASSLTPILLFQVPFFVYATTYSNGLRQLASLHGMAKMLSANYPDDGAPSTDAPSPLDSSSVIPAASPSPSRLLETFYSFLHQFNSNKSSALDVLLILVKQPFEDVREAVWKVVLGLTNHAWGVSVIAHTGGFLEYLLDRKTEFHVSGMQAKFAIVRALATSPHASKLQEASLKQVKEYARQGAHYAPLTVGVMGPVSGAQS